MMTRLSAVVVFSVLLAVMFSGSAQSPLSTNWTRQDSSWTIMMYMADDFASSLNWQEDFNEIEAALQAPGTNIIALVDQYGPDNSTLYKILHDPNFLDPALISTAINDSGAVISGGEVNMAAASTLQAFIEFSAALYPADKYVLVLWGHGAGWRGLCPDGIDVLTLQELGDALSQATSTIGRPLDLVVVDSCAEATMETLWEIHEYSRLFVASEKDVPFQGLPYVIVMNELAAMPSQSVEEFASKIADDYVLWSSTNTDYSVTMGVFNLSRMEPLVTALNALSAQGQKYDPIFHDVLRAAFNESEGYEEAYCVDFGHFMWQLQKADLPLEIRHYAIESLQEVMAVVDHFAKYGNPNPINGVHVRNASGLTIFAPSAGVADDTYGNISLATSNWYGFGRLLRNDTLIIPNGPGPSVSYSSSNSSANGTSIGLPKDIATLTWSGGVQIYTIWVFRNLSGGLVYLFHMAIYSSEFSISGYPGPLTLATSSHLDGRLNSYRTVNITLDGSVRITVQVTRDGMLANHLSDEYDISVVVSDGKRLAPAQLPPIGADNSCSFLVRVPEDAIVGDLVMIEIVDRSSGDIVGMKRVFVPRNATTVNVEVLIQCDCPYRIVVPLLLALLPGLLILGFALSLHYQKRNEKGKKVG